MLQLDVAATHPHWSCAGRTKDRLRVTLAKRLSLLLAVISLCLFSVSAYARSFQPILRLACPSGEFAMDARPYEGNAAGSSRVEQRYRYRGVDLAFINYEAYYHNLNSYMRQASRMTYHLGLELDTSGASKTSGAYQSGDTIYLPPNRFSSDEARQLASCLAMNQHIIRDAFQTNVIRGRTFLGLMATRSRISHSGVARVVFADAPIKDIYGDFIDIVVVEKTGRVVILTNLVASTPADSVVWGYVVSSKRGKPVLRAKARVMLAGKELEGIHFLVEKNARGSRLKDDYSVVLE